MAERVGFEPTVPLRGQRFSRPSESATLAPLHFTRPPLARQDGLFPCHPPTPRLVCTRHPEPAKTGSFPMGRALFPCHPPTPRPPRRALFPGIGSTVTSNALFFSLSPLKNCCSNSRLSCSNTPPTIWTR